MKSYLPYINILAFIILFITIIISFHNNNVLESRIGTLRNLLSKDLKVDKLSSEKTFKEDYYITQQSSDTALILTCFGSGLVIFSFLTFNGVVSCPIYK